MGAWLSHSLFNREMMNPLNNRSLKEIKQNENENINTHATFKLQVMWFNSDLFGANKYCNRSTTISILIGQIISSVVALLKIWLSEANNKYHLFLFCKNLNFHMKCVYVLIFCLFPTHLLYNCADLCCTCSSTSLSKHSFFFLLSWFIYIKLDFNCWLGTRPISYVCHILDFDF